MNHPTDNAGHLYTTLHHEGRSRRRLGVSESSNPTLLPYTPLLLYSAGKAHVCNHSIAAHLPIRVASKTSEVDLAHSFLAADMRKAWVKFGRTTAKW